MSLISKVQKRDIDIVIVIPDFPFDRRINYECYRLFRQHFSFFFRNYATMYVMHGYWEAILDGVEADILAIPFNILSDIPRRELVGVRTSRLDESTLRYILCRTIRHGLEHGYRKFHLLGPPGIVIYSLYKAAPTPATLPDGTVIDDVYFRHVLSFDTAEWHWSGRKWLDNRAEEPLWLVKWLREKVRIFEIEYW